MIMMPPEPLISMTPWIIFSSFVWSTNMRKIQWSKKKQTSLRNADRKSYTRDSLVQTQRPAPPFSEKGVARYIDDDANEKQTKTHYDPHMHFRKINFFFFRLCFPPTQLKRLQECEWSAKCHPISQFRKFQTRELLIEPFLLSACVSRYLILIPPRALCHTSKKCIMAHFYVFIFSYFFAPSFSVNALRRLLWLSPCTFYSFVAHTHRL